MDLNNAIASPSDLRLSPAPGWSVLTALRRALKPIWPQEKLSKAGLEGAGENAGDTRGVEAEDWQQRLRDEKQSLHEMMQGMEQEFLGTGGALMDLAEKLAAIGPECECLTALTLGHSSDAGIQFAFQLLKKGEDLVVAIHEHYRQVIANFRHLQARLAKLSRWHDSLVKGLSPLTIIAMAFRIEASRRPSDVQHSFLTLAANVNRAVNEVRIAMAEQFAEMMASERIAHKLMEKISGTLSADEEDVTATLAGTRLQLQTVGDAYRTSGDGVSSLAGLNRVAAGHIGDIVLALQSQDITRQKVEHIGAAIEELTSALAEIAENGGADGTTQGFVSKAAAIQRLQLEGVFSDLAQAGRQITTGLANLHTEVMETAKIATKVANSALDTKVGAQCENGIANLLKIIGRSVERIGGVLSAFDSLSTGFRDCTNRSSELAADLRYTALNAQIFAIQVPDGAALEVLSGRVRAISDEAIRHIGEMGVEIRGIIEMAANLRQQLADFQQLAQGEIAILTEESNVSRQKLAGLERAIPEKVGHISEQQSSFAQCVTEVLAGVRFPARIDAAREQSIRLFEELAEWSSRNEPSSEGDDHDASDERRADHLMQRYTMESERQIHESVLWPAVRGPNVATAAPVNSSANTGLVCAPVPSASASTTDLGDNIELF